MRLERGNGLQSNEVWTSPETQQRECHCLVIILGKGYKELGEGGTCRYLLTNTCRLGPAAVISHSIQVLDENQDFFGFFGSGLVASSCPNSLTYGKAHRMLAPGMGRAASRQSKQAAASPSFLIDRVPRHKKRGACKSSLRHKAKELSSKNGRQAPALRKKERKKKR